MNLWDKLYRVDIEEFSSPDEYVKYKLKYKKKFINTIKKYAPNGKTLEVGCGTGLVSGYLSRIGFDSTAIDISEKVLDLVREISCNSEIISTPKLKRMSIFDLDFQDNQFDVSFSNGVLEHFSDDEIINTLNQQLRISKYVIFGVPSTYFGENEKMYGDERRLNSKDWENLVKKTNAKIVLRDGFHYYPLIKRITEIKKYFRPKAFYLFAITKVV